MHVLICTNQVNATLELPFLTKFGCEKHKVRSSHMYLSIKICITIYLCTPFFTLFSSEWGCASWLNVSHHPMGAHFELLLRVGGDIASWRWNPPVDMLQTNRDRGHKSRYLCLESLVQMNASTTMCSYILFNST